MKTRKILRKLLASSLAVAMIGGVASVAPLASVFDAGIVASAVNSSPVVTVGDYQYVLYDDGTASVVGYTGTKNLSASSVGMPSVVYAKDVDTTWTYLQYHSSYNVTQMNAGIFNNCKFKSLSLPSKLQALTGGFYGAEIGAFFIDSSNSYFSSYSVSGAYALYNKGQTTLYAYPSNPSLYTSSFGTATKGFASSLTRVEDQAFASSKLSTVTLPASVTYAGDRLFRGSSITKVIFEGNAPTFRFMPSSTIPDHGTFEAASSLINVEIKGKEGSYNTDTYGNIYNKAMTKLILVPQGRTNGFNVASTCTEIGDYAFYHSNANGPVIYDQVKTIGSYAFSDVKSSFKAYILKDTPADTYFKSRSIPYTYAYEYTTASDGVTITKYDGPYSYPAVPTSINGKSVIAIGKDAFRGNTKLTGVSMSSPLSTIDEYAFYGCTNVTRVDIPYTVTNIGKYAFYNCKKLKLTTLPSRLVKIGEYAFGFNTAIEEMTIPNNVTTMNYSAFYGCSNLTSLTIGTGLKTIGSYAFENTGLTTQYIPPTVTTIGAYAFGYKFADNTHSRNTAFTSISGYPDSAAEKYAKDNNIPFNSVIKYSISNNKVTIEGYTGTDTTLTIPATIEGKPVTSIKGYAFSGSKLTKIVLPEGLTKIDGYAFYGCNNLTSVTIPSTVTSIGSYAFEFCWSLTSFTVPRTVTSIGSGAFYGCTSLASLTMYSGLTSIGSTAFTNTALTAVTIPTSVTSIGDHAFGYDYADSTYTLVDGFKMTGYVDTAAEEYADANPGIIFSPKYETFLNTSTISKTSITLGDYVQINAGATGGKKPYEYAVFYRKGTSGTFTTLQDFSTDPSITFTPSSSGTYTVMVTVSDKRGATASKSYTVTVVAPALYNVSYISDEEITLGESVTIYGRGSGGEAPYKYSIFAKGANENDYKPLQMADSNSVVVFDPEAAGTYDILVVVFDSAEQSEEKYFTLYVNEPVHELENTSKLSSNKVQVNTAVKISGGATGGTEPYAYAFYYKRSVNTKWNKIGTEFGTAVAVNFTPTAVAEYDIKVIVKDSAGNTDEKIMKLTAFDQSLKNTSWINAEKVQIGDDIRVTGGAEGGAGGYKYAFYFKRSVNTKWNKIGTEFGTATYGITVPKAAANYDMKVIVKDSKGATAEKISTVEVVESLPLTNISYLNAYEITVGKTVTAAGRFIGGTKPVTYEFYFKRSANTKWNKLSYGNEKGTYAKFTPTAEADYDIKVIVTDSLNAKSEKIMKLKAAAAED